MRRHVTVFTVALLAAGCDLVHDDCEVLVDGLGAPVCSAPARRVLEDPVVGLGFEIPEEAHVRSGSTGTIASVAGNTLHIDVEGTPIVFRWHGALPHPVSVGDRVVVGPGQEKDILEFGDGEWMVFKPRAVEGSLMGASHRGSELCIAPIVGCQVDDALYGIDFHFRSPLFEAVAAPGETAQIGNWKVSNLGATWTPALDCGDVAHTESTSGHFLAWTVGVSGDPAWCSPTVREAHSTFRGSYGMLRPLGDEQRRGTISEIGEGGVVKVATEGGTMTFEWPGALPAGLRVGDAVELDAGGGQAILKTASLSLWVLDTAGFTTAEVSTERLGEGPEVVYEDGCVLSNSAVSQDARVLWEGDTVRLQPGESGVAGPWQITHHHGFHAGLLDCGMSYDSAVRRVTSAFRTLGD